MYSCTDDCAKLQNILLPNWTECKPKAVIYYLVKTYDRLSKSLPTLDKYFNDTFKYPVIIFYEKEFTSDIPALKNMSTSQLFFQEVQFVVPDFVGNLSHYKITCTHYEIGYRHMCRFHSKIVYDLPIMTNFNYYWRLDDDSFLTRNVSYGFEYGYNNIQKDQAQCIINLWSNATAFIKMSKVKFKPRYFYKWPERGMFYNNFEISKTSIWKEEIYQEFIDYLDHARGIYVNRWGDAPIKSIGLSLFLDKSKLHKFRDIGYRHKGLHIM